MGEGADTQEVHAFGWDADVTAGGFDADTDANVAEMPQLTWQALQRDILSRSAPLVRPDGGVLVFATCSLLDAENGDNARWFERQQWGGGAGEKGSRFVPLPFPSGWPVDNITFSAKDKGEGAGLADGADERAGAGTKSPSNEVALLPHVHGTDGFYIARWARD